MIDTWRSTERKSPKLHNSSDSLADALLPSGRQAIIETMRAFGLERTSRLAVPEFSSHCVLSSVSTLATPIPMNEVIANDLKPDCILLYEQWGWPIIQSSLEKLLNSGSKIILDCVDSPDAINRHETLRDNQNVRVIISLSKCLGLSGGGLIIGSDNHLKNTSDHEHSFDHDDDLMKLGDHFYKTYGETLKPISHWLKANNTANALEEETTDRSNNLQALINSKLSENWPVWMVNSVETQCAAGIAPLYKYKTVAELNAISATLEKRHDIIAPVYNFNWSGDPLNPEYAQCIAMPCHGEIKLEELTSDLEKLQETHE